MSAIKWLTAICLFGSALSAPQEEVTGPKVPRAGISISTPDFKSWGERVAGASKQPTEVVKESVDLVKDTVKMGTNLGGAVVDKGLHVTKEGIKSVNEIGNLGIDMGTTIANKTLGIFGKVGGMVPVAGTLITSGISLGQQGVTQVNSIGKMLLGSISGLLGGGLGWLSNATSLTTSLVGTAADSVGSVVNTGLDYKAGAVGSMIETGFSILPSVNINASINMG